MEITRVPWKIKVLSGLALFFPLFAMIQIAVAEKLPYWKLNLNVFYPTLPIVSILTLVLLWLFARGGRFTRVYFTILASIWIFISLVHALEGNSVYYGLTLLLLVSWCAFYGWLLFGAFNSPYLDSGQRWFEGAPPAIPKIKASLQNSLGALGPYSVARIGNEGVYLVGPELSISGKKLSSSDVDLKLEFKNRTLEVKGTLIRSRLMNKGSAAYGIGIQFKNLDQDLKKEIADFVEILRGEGHVS